MVKYWGEDDDVSGTALEPGIKGEGKEGRSKKTLEKKVEEESIKVSREDALCQS